MGENISKTSTFVKAPLPPSNVYNLDQVALFTICQYLKVQGIARVQQTCLTWNLIARSDSIWNMALARDLRIANTSSTRTAQQFYRSCLAAVRFQCTLNYPYSRLDISILVHRLYSNKPIMTVSQYYQEELYGDTISTEQHIVVEWVEYLKRGQVQRVEPIIVQANHVLLFHVGKEFELSPNAFSMDQVTIARVPI